MSKKIKLTKNQFTIIDDEDYELVNKFKWYSGHSGDNFFYVINRKGLYLHRFIMNVPKGKIIDHINHNTFDNRKCNLRIVTQSQNNMNKIKKRNTTSKYKGVNWSKNHKRWISQIRINGKGIHLGCYKTEYEAALAYNEKAKKLFGQFAYLNKID